jgi:hypothetical protein
MKLLAAAIVLLWSTHALAQEDLPSKGLRDTAILMLREFVTIGGDHRLGFTPENVFQAKIDLEHPMSFFSILEDSLLTSMNFEKIFVSINKVIYPVRVGNQVCGSISFGHDDAGWHVREFQDSAEIATYMKTMARIQTFKGIKNYVLAYLPSLNHFVILENNRGTVTITSPNILNPEAADDFYPESVDFLEKPQIPLDEFIKGYREHLQSEGRLEQPDQK